MSITFPFPVFFCCPRMKLAEQFRSPCETILAAFPRVFDLRISQQRTWKGFLSRAQSSLLDTIPLIKSPSPSELRPILPPTTPASVKDRTSGPFSFLSLRKSPLTWGIQSQFCAMIKCPFSTVVGSVAKAVQPKVLGNGFSPIFEN